MLVDESHVITCAHVVTLHLGGDVNAEDAQYSPGDAIVVRFPFAEPVTIRRARVVGWRPIEKNLSGDAALLKLDEPVPLTPAPLACPPSVSGHGFSVHGFPGGSSAARHAQGRLGSASGPTGEWIQIEAEGPTGWSIEHGFSGAPVFDHDADAVVGIVALRDQNRSGHLLPVSYLRTLWPWLGSRIGWRLDLDSSLKTHWLPRARGSELESDTGYWYFTGRQTARQAICDWLVDTGRPSLVVLGGPGTGKSALLGHLLVAADPVLAAIVPTNGPRPQVGSVDIAIHVKGLTCDDVVERLASAAAVEATDPEELLVAVREAGRSSQRPLTVLVDAVEEAVSVEEAQHIATLLRKLADTRAVRVLAGVRTAAPNSQRARVVQAFGRTTSRIDLESRQFLRNYDIVEYVERRLVSEDTGGSRYRDRPPDEIRTIARAIARKARYNFLIAQLTSRWLANPNTPSLDLTAPAWDQELPETIGQAMDTYLDTCGPTPPWCDGC
jgi:hypothetical protein